MQKQQNPHLPPAPAAKKQRRVDSHQPTITAEAAEKKIKLPPQLVSLIQGEERQLEEEGYLSLPLAAAATTTAMVANDGMGGDEAPSTNQARHSTTSIVAAAQNRFTKELCSYTRVVCMRLGYAS